ncbi:DUF4375 domain-containing protein [Pedobacter sp. KBS0701]|uniref:DMP19 family protein n=1 Tax=Pedobacter sp. KBS0701 TaxID=2578106 RepID=UPI00110DD4B3|nr:DUF4375 domain-containing protein [Pedobacter sp. KBS0701]QDW25901.1 DUF4375 domain-containing protein [Pedobacter sp. KBS0701]
MKPALLFFFAITLLCCHQSKEIKNKSYTLSEDPYTASDKGQQLRPEFSKLKFDILHNWDFGWAILEPINIAKSRADDKELSKRFSSGQKALYFFWYLDEEVTNGGFIQFYVNEYREYLPAIKKGLILIGDQEMIDLISKADEYYLNNKDSFNELKKNNKQELIFSKLEKFNEYDEAYYKIHDNTMKFLEKYARKHPYEFVILK